MDRIILHWTAGTYKPNSTEKSHYHFLIDGKGLIHLGVFKPEDNKDCLDGAYAAHTGGGNTGSIGVALCGMAELASSKKDGKYPLTRIQCENAFKFVAELCDKYNIPVTAKTVLTHMEFGIAHPRTTSYGKIDLCYLPPYPYMLRDSVGNFIRNKVKWYLEQRKG